MTLPKFYFKVGWGQRTERGDAKEEKDVECNFYFTEDKEIINPFCLGGSICKRLSGIARAICNRIIFSTRLPKYILPK